MQAFSTVWKELTTYAQSRDHVETLAHRSRNQIAYDASHDAIRVDHDEPELLHRADLEEVWQTFQEDGALQRENTREALGMYRASVTLALLARALDLPYDSRPITVYPE